MLIILKATQYQRAQKAKGTATSKSDRKKSQMTKTILFLTFFYIALVLPDLLYIGYFCYIIDFNYAKMMANLTNFIQFFFSSFSIFILYFSNKQFAKEVKMTIFRVKINQVSSMTGTKSQSVINNRLSNVLQQTI